MLELRHITRKFSAFTVVDDVSFTLRPGEVLGYLGPNGAGKTTTIRMLAGLLPPTRGEILFDGVPIKKSLIAYKARLGYVPEQSEIYPHLSGGDYLLLAGRLRGLPEATLRRRISGLLEVFGLADDRHVALSSYSKGMRQKILLAAALLHDPQVLLLDEPLSGLDVTTGLVVRDLVRALAARGRMILYSSHVLEVTEKICSRVIILHRGQVAADDSVDNLRQLMRLPTLADIFSQLVVREDPAAAAARIVEVIA